MLFKGKRELFHAADLFVSAFLILSSYRHKMSFFFVVVLLSSSSLFHF